MTSVVRVNNEFGVYIADMRPAHVIEIITPKKYLLRGLWYGPKKPQKVVVWIHGLSSSMFSMAHVVHELVSKDTAVVVFNNRGYGIINKIPSVQKKGKTKIAGAAHEIFSECIDDIQGAVAFVRKQGVRNIYLAGHSTGCQKAIYWASKSDGGRGVKGIILVAPVSDYAAGKKLDERNILPQAIKYAQMLVKKGKKDELMPAKFLTAWSVDDAQRFLSLYSPDSIEEIFSYSQPRKNASTLKKVKVPILIVWAENDAYADRPATEILEWFGRNIRSHKSSVLSVNDSDHGFQDKQRVLANKINKWISAL